ncbi:MAG: hypothetical protein KA715_00285 [Xanthomonadaceae bacterium]|nr:hypothetical protein [Xanthomonadaceae bacterium]
MLASKNMNNHFLIESKNIMNIALVVALTTLSNANADYCSQLEQLANQIGLVSEKLSTANASTNITTELELMIELQETYDQVSTSCGLLRNVHECNSLNSTRDALLTASSKMRIALAQILKQMAQENLCKSKITLETSNAFEVSYEDSNILSDTLNLNQKEEMVSLVTTFSDGTSKITNF